MFLVTSFGNFYHHQLRRTLQRSGLLIDMIILITVNGQTSAISGSNLVY